MLLAGQILATAAVIYENKYATQIQNYGPEARGGSSVSELVISEREIDYPQILKADCLLCMSQESCDKYFYDLKREGLLIVDTDHVKRLPTSRAIALPLTSLAREATGREFTASILGIGLIAGLSGVLSREAVEKALADRVPPGTLELNLKALATGYKEAERIKAGNVKPGE